MIRDERFDNSLMQAVYSDFAERMSGRPRQQLVRQERKQRMGIGYTFSDTITIDSEESLPGYQGQGVYTQIVLQPKLKAGGKGSVAITSSNNGYCGDFSYEDLRAAVGALRSIFNRDYVAAFAKELPDLREEWQGSDEVQEKKKGEDR